MPPFLVTFVVFCAFFEGTTALKCYSGEFENREGAKQREPRLRDCERYEDLCLSYYNRDDITLRGNNVMPGGSWGKNCEDRSSTLIEEFNGDFSERCIETEKGIMSGTIIMCICNTDRCNHEKELDVKSTP